MHERHPSYYTPPRIADTVGYMRMARKAAAECECLGPGNAYERSARAGALAERVRHLGKPLPARPCANTMPKPCDAHATFDRAAAVGATGAVGARSKLTGGTTAHNTAGGPERQSWGRYGPCAGFEARLP